MQTLAMWRLVKYLEENGEAIIRFVDSTQRTDHGITEKLIEIRPDISDKERQELGTAIISAMWLGCKAQDRKAASFFRDAVLEAFESGRRYALMQ